MRGFTGRLALIVRADAGGRSVLGRGESRGSLRFLRPLPEENGLMTLPLVGQGAGLLAGDRQRIRLDVRAGARLRLAPIAAQLVMDCRGGRAIETVLVRLGAEASLHWAAQPTIPFAGAALNRQVRLFLEDSSRLLWEEFLLFGRIARGERFAMEAYRSRLSAHDPKGRLLLAEGIRLPFPVGDATGKGFFGPADGLWTGLFLAPEASLNQAEDFLGHLGREGWWGFSRLPERRGLVIRAIGSEAELHGLRERVREGFGPLL